jgi:hypothetical protein
LTPSVTTGQEPQAAEGPPQSQLVKPEAVSKVGEGLRARLEESIGDPGKAIATLAGLGVFFFAAGYFVEWQRLNRGDLPPEGIVPLIPKEQIAAAGVRELVISIAFVVVSVAVFGYGLVRIASAAQGRESWWARGVHYLFEREVLFPTAAFGLITLVIVPFSRAGIIVAVVLTALLYYTLCLVRGYLAPGKEKTDFPLWRLLLALALAAVVLTGARQWEFPEPRPLTHVVLTNGVHIHGSYIASDSDKVLVRVRRSGEKPQLIAFNRDRVKVMRLRESALVIPRAGSLLDRAVRALSPSEIRLSCIPPECRWGDSRVGISSFF